MDQQDLASQLRERFGGSAQLVGWRSAWLVPISKRASSSSNASNTSSGDSDRARERESPSSSASEEVVPGTVSV